MAEETKKLNQSRRSYSSINKLKLTSPVDGITELYAATNNIFTMFKFFYAHTNKLNLATHTPLIVNQPCSHISRITCGFDVLWTYRGCA